MQDQWYMFDAQALWVQDVFMNAILLQDRATLEAGPIARQAAEDALEDDHGCIAYQGAYTKELIDETDYPSFDIETANRASYGWEKHKKKGIMKFRDHGYNAPMTGTMAPAHHTTWKDALDNSLEAYLPKN